MKTRGFWSVNQRLGNIVIILRSFIKTRKKVSVLEVGCGYGIAMNELKEKFPELNVVGMNYRKYPEQIKGLKYIYGDAGKKIHLPNNSIDLIYSIATLHSLEIKLNFLRKLSEY